LPEPSEKYATYSKSRGDTSYMYVLAYSGEERDKLQRERFEQHMKEQEQRQKHVDGDGNEDHGSDAQS
jgi:hypothetical protein